MIIVLYRKNSAQYKKIKKYHIKMSKLNFKDEEYIARLPKSENIVIKITETLIKEMGELFNCHHCQNSKAGLHNNA